MNIFYIILSIILLTIPNTCLPDCTTKLPISPTGDKDPLLYPYIKYMFSMDDCSINDQMKFKIKTDSDSKKWEETVVGLGNRIYVNLFLDKSKYPNEYLLDNDGTDKNKEYIFRNIMLFPETYGSLLCLSYPTVNGSIPLICQDYNGPSRHHDPDDDDPTIANNPCYTNTHHSKTFLNFSGRVIDCMTQTLDEVFFRKSLSSRSVIANFVDFQHSLQQAIFAALMLYVIFFGIRIILEPDKFDLASASKFVLTFIFVLYFSIGLSSFSWDGSKIVDNGVVTQALPFFKAMSSSLANLVLSSSSGSGLCDFSSVSYDNGKEFYRLWDSIDCRLFNYLGVTDKEFNPTGVNLINPDAIFRLNFFSLLFAFIVSGNVLLFIFGTIFILYFLSLMLFFISTFCVYLVTLYVMVYISPIFIPMALFEKTRGYFDAWLRICVSCSLQPAILAGFIVLMMSFYDHILYTGCDFKSIIDSNGMIYFPYADSISEECKNSLGIKLIRYYTGEGADQIDLLLFKVPYIKDVLNISSQMLLMMFFCILGYFFSKYLTAFSASITGGPNVGNVTFSPSKDKKDKEDKKDKKNNAKNDITGGSGAKSKDNIAGSNSASRDKIAN